MLIAATKEHYEGTMLGRTKAERDDPKAFLFMFKEPEKKNYSVVTGKDGKREALISVSGELGKSRYWGTTYSDIRENIIEAEKEGVDRIVLEINSPGGFVDGVEETANIIRNTKTETVARVSYMAASAAYWLACACDKIEATTALASFGSIGVIVSYWDWKEHLEQAGIKEVIITSTDAPKKYVDPATEEGRLEVIERLDKIHSVFVKRVAEGRNTTIDKVNKEFGQGAIVFADDALAKGMIDAINHNILEEKGMEKTHEELNAQIQEAVKAARTEAVKHLKFAAYVDPAKISENILNGKSFADCAEEYYEAKLASDINAKRVENQEEPEGLVSDEGVEEGLNKEKLNEEARKEGLI